LLALQIGMFGSRLDCETMCPTCATRLELSLDASELVIPERKIEPHELELSDDDWTVRFRLPDSTDIAASVGASDDVLAERCIALIDRKGNTEVGALPITIRERVAERMAALDPQADVSLDLSCAACGHRWQSPFDVASFLFREVDAHVARLTREVHQLARSYGWSEASILAMGSVRRRRYLALVLQ